MVDVLDLSPNETAFLDTTANIVAIVSANQRFEIMDDSGNILAVLNAGEVYTLGYNKGVYRIRNAGSSSGRAYVFRQFIL